jgi:hypothetical protein
MIYQLVFVILLVVSDISEGRYDRNDSYSFPSETVITVVIKFTYIMSTSSTNVRLFFQKFSISNTLCTPLLEILHAGSVQTFAETSELFMHALFRLVVRKTASSECIIQGGQKDVSRRVPNSGLYGKEDLIYLPVCLNPSNSLF